MIWSGFIVPCSVSSRWIVSSVIEPAPWLPTDRDAVDRGDVDRVAGRVLGHVARGRQEPWPHLSEVTVGRRPEAARNSSVASTRRSIWPVADVVAAAVVDVDPRVGEHAPDERLLAHQQDLADRRVARRRRRRTGSCRRRGRSRSTRAASSRRGSASGRCAGRRGRPGGSRTAGAARGGSSFLPRRPRIVPATTRAPGRRRLSWTSLRPRPKTAGSSPRSSSRRRSCRCARTPAGRRRRPRRSGRVGLANRRCFVGTAGLRALATVLRGPLRFGLRLRPARLGRRRGGRGGGRGGRGVALRQLELLGDLLGGRRAAASAPGSGLATFARCAYVYVLP